MINHWIFIVVDHRDDDRTITAREVFEGRVRDGFWSLNKSTGNFHRLNEGDRVVFYVGGREGQKFVGKGALASRPYEMTPGQKNRLIGYPSLLFSHAVNLKDIEVWSEPKTVVDLKDGLSFIKNKKAWRAYFRRSIIAIGEEDYDLIVKP